MMKTPRLLAVLVAMTALFAIAGCGSDDNDSGGAPTPRRPPRRRPPAT